MGNIVELVVGVIFMLLGWNFAYVVAWKNLVTLLSYKPKAIASAQIGEKIQVAGKLAGKVSQFSPVTQTPCVCWRVIVTEAKGKNTTLTLLDKQSNNNFMVGDRSGMVEVQHLLHQRPLIKLGNDSFTFSTYNFSAHDFVGLGKPQHHLHQNILQDFADRRAIAFLEEHNIKREGYFGNRKSITIREYLWQPGDSIYVWGKLIRGDRHTKTLHPWLVSYSQPRNLILILIFIGLLGLLFFSFGCTITYQMLQY